MDEQIDKWLNGWMDRQIDKWLKHRIYSFSGEVNFLMGGGEEGGEKT